MFRFRALLLTLLLALMACESPADKISRLQRETLEALGTGDTFEIKAQSQTFKLVLPSEPGEAEQSAKKIAAIHQESMSVEQGSLSPADQRRLQQLNANLAMLVQAGAGSTFDPSKCVVADLLKDNSNGAVAKILLQKIPEYYAEVERRWQRPNKSRAQTAAQQSLRSLELLDAMGDDARLARLAVKDFIGMCQSAVCLN